MAELTLGRAAAPVSLKQVMPAGLLNMFTLGASTTLYGPAVVYLAQETGQPAQALGALFAFHWAGFFASTFATNRIARRLEMRRGLILGLLLIAVGALGLIALPFPANIAAVFLVGLGNGASEVLFNRLVELLAGDQPAKQLSRLHSTWGVGAIAIPLVVVGVVWAGLNWRAAGLFVIAVALADLVMVMRWREFRVPHGAGTSGRAVPWRSVGLFVAIVAVYGALETAVSAWAATFFAQLGQGVVLGSLATSLFFLTFAFGRVTLAGATDRLGFGRAVRMGTLAGAGALLITFVPSLALVGFALTGVSLSIVFPTMLAWAPRRHPELRAEMVSLVLAALSLGGIVGPYVIGLGVGALGAWSLTPMLVVVALVVSGLSLFEPSPRP